MKAPLKIGILYLYLLKRPAASTPDVDSRVKIPDALTPEQYQKVEKLTANQEFIDNEVKDQLKKLGELHSSISSIIGNDPDLTKKSSYESLMSDDSILYSESTVNMMEAPVIYLEPPLVLPSDQIKADKEVDSFLKSSGLEKESKDMSDDPYKITSIDDAKTSERALKSRIAKMRSTREGMFKRMRKLSLDIPGDAKSLEEFNKLKGGIAKLDEDLKGEITKLDQLEHVKAALINKRGPGSDAEQREEELESREEDIEREEEGYRGDTEGEDEESDEF